jgi:two-component system, cell cycle sensor histidine kinase and response regulator CckA
MTERLRVLVVDDAPEHAEMVVQFLRSGSAFPHAEFQIAATYDEALQAFQGKAFDVAFFDYWLGSRDGLTLLRDVRLRAIDTPVVILTSRGAEEVAVEAMKAGAADYLSKTNLTAEALERAIRYALALGVEDRHRREAEAARRASDDRFRALVENSYDVLMLLDEQGRLTYITPAAARVLGWHPESMLGQSVFESVHPEDVDLANARFAEAMKLHGHPVTAQVRLQHADGTWRTVDGIGVNRLQDPLVKAVVVNVRDVTDRLRLEEQLRQSQKMEAIGQLAGGVAHDFNNLLTAILGYCNLILEEVPTDAAMRQDLEEIRSAGERAAALTRQLLAFSRRQMLQPQTLDVNDLIRQIERLLRRLISEDVQLTTTLAADLWPVKVDPASLEQVLINLAVNGRDAMPLGGRLTLETSNAELEAPDPDRDSIPPGRYVKITVSDSGHGMDAATQARVFEPFFTTKEQGKGSGLGLATVYGIVKQSDGYIWVTSETGHGTMFSVFLPRADTPAITAAAPRAPEVVERGSETVLLVEDEDAVRALAGAVLRRHGYTVLEACHGLDALRVAERHSDVIHLMITDVVMPHMSGRDLAQRLGAARQHMKVLFMSGYTDHAVVHRDLTPGTAFLQKPFTPDAFARKVRHVLDF